MAYTVNNNTLKNGNNKKKKNQWIPLIIIVVLALILVALNWFLIDFTSGLYSNAPTTVETTVEQGSN